MIGRGLNSVQRDVMKPGAQFIYSFFDLFHRRVVYQSDFSFDMTYNASTRL